MNTITTTASTSVSILGIDLGKCKSVACRQDLPSRSYPSRRAATQ
jgi:hypothetical protein